MTISAQMTDLVLLAKLGERVARARLERNLTQDQLAHEAGVSKRTLLRMENGESTQLTSVIRVLRALGLLGALDSLLSNAPPSPLEQLRMQKKKERRRASPRGGSRLENPSGWTWADEAVEDERSPD